MPIAHRSIRPGDQTNPDSFGSMPNQEGFIQMREAFQACGGLAHGHMLDRVFELQGRADRVAPLILSGQLLAFDWRRMRWIPLFQLDGRKLALSGPVLQEALARLKTWCTPWQAAAWFADCNAGLDGARPMEMMKSDPSSVLDAARSDGSVDTPYQPVPLHAARRVGRTVHAAAP